MLRLLRSIQQHTILRFCLLWLFLIVLLSPAFHAGFNGDFEGLLYYYKHYGFIDFINSKDFSVKSLYQVTQIQLYTYIYLFGTSSLAWYLLLTFWHALNSWLIHSFVKKLLVDFKVPHAAAIALWTALLFLTNPNVTDVTIWKGGYHYLTALAAQLAIMIWLQQYLHTQRRTYLYLALSVFLLSSFTLELFYLSPIFCLILTIAYRWKGLIDKTTFVGVLKKFNLPLVFIFVFHLILFRLRFGSWIAHYGSVNGLVFTPETFLPKLPKYLFTILGFAAQIHHDLSKPVYLLMDQPLVYYGVYALALGFAFYGLLRFKHLIPSLQVSVIFWGMMLLCVIIISPINFDELMQLYNSRYCYELSFPVYALCCIALFTINKSGQIAHFLLLILLGLGLFFSIQKSNQWKDADHIQRSLLEQYKWQQKKKVIILNMPCYYRDIRVLPTGTFDEFKEHLSVFGYDTAIQPIHYISSYNMNHVSDGAHVSTEDAYTLRVTLNQWGSWWMYDLKGAFNREEEMYRLEMIDVGHEYLLHLKEPIDEWTILYQEGTEWKMLDPTKKSQATIE